jgi:hypothetical protein
VSAFRFSFVVLVERRLKKFVVVVVKKRFALVTLKYYTDIR